MPAALAALLLAAAPANLLNARLETRAPAGHLSAVVQEIARSRPGPAWIGYSVPARGSEHICCFDSGSRRGACPGCALEGNRIFTSSNVRPPSVRLSPRAEVLILYRVFGGRVGDVRVYSSDCKLDASGLPLVWLEGVTAAESLAFLRTRVDVDEDDALSAIAQHADPAADQALVELARTGRPGEVRSQALFWLAQVASQKAVGEISRAIAEDPETEVKKQAVFALSEMADGTGVPHLIDLARRHENPAVREQAFFWLGESEDPRALAFFEEVLRK